MTILFSYLILIFYCLLNLIGKKIISDIIVSFLLTVATITISFSLQNSRLVRIPLYAYIFIALLYPSLYLFLPVFFFEITRQKEYIGIAPLLAGIVYHFGTNDIYFLFFLLLGCILAFFLQSLIERYDILSAKHRKMRDDSTELNLLLKQRNHTLLEKQNYEIHNATLQERNRIAREIHDNVGHLLSRCILLNGMLQTINQDENCKESLNILQETLSQAMENIRSSVHNLHDDSINLQGALQTLIQDFSFCPVRLDYDISPDVPSPVRYALISITKEALTNISRHSNATNVDITLREHPAMYQLIVHDNGQKLSKNFSFDEKTPDSSGIGLINMYDRVKTLNGIFQIRTENGFQIFVSIPKE